MIGAFVERCRSRASAVYCGNDRILCRALENHHIFLDARDIGITPNLVCDGFWEPGISVAMERHLRPGMTAVDIGANIGYFTLLMASKVGGDGQVVAIEPNPRIAGLLRETVAVNRLQSRVAVHNVAAADEDGELDFFIIPEHTLNACIVLDEWTERVSPSQVHKVPAAAADTILDAYPRVDFIKIDVEGGEHLVWKGLSRTLDRNPGISVILEYNYNRHSTAGSVVEMFERQGFIPRQIDLEGELKPVERASLFDETTLDDIMLFLNRGEET